MASYTYEGPANHLIVDGKAYAPGDSVSLAKERAEALVARGHRFREFAADVTRRVSVTPTPTPSVPRGDDGAMLTDLRGPDAPSKADVRAAEQRQPIIANEK